MKRLRLRSLMLVALGAAMAVLIPIPTIAAPNTYTNDIQVAAFKLQSSEAGLFLSEDAFPEDLAGLMALVVKADWLVAPEMQRTNSYIVIKDEGDCALTTMPTEDAIRFILANNKTTAVTFRPLVAIRTEGVSYILMAIYHAMNTQTPLPPTVLAQHHLNKTGGGMFLVNTQYDLQASTLQPNSSMSWGAAN